ncbi:MAG: hypothetical protein ABR909_06970 [Candidatus Bathyarchaeia archaeon]
MKRKRKQLYYGWCGKCDNIVISRFPFIGLCRCRSVHIVKLKRTNLTLNEIREITQKPQCVATMEIPKETPKETRQEITYVIYGAE